MAISSPYHADHSCMHAWMAKSALFRCLACRTRATRKYCIECLIMYMLAWFCCMLAIKTTISQLALADSASDVDVGAYLRGPGPLPASLLTWMLVMISTQLSQSACVKNPYNSCLRSRRCSPSKESRALCKTSCDLANAVLGILVNSTARTDIVNIWSSQDLVTL